MLLTLAEVRQGKIFRHICTCGVYTHTHPQRNKSVILSKFLALTNICLESIWSLPILEIRLLTDLSPGWNLTWPFTPQILLKSLVRCLTSPYSSCWLEFVDRLGLRLWSALTWLDRAKCSPTAAAAAGHSSGLLPDFAHLRPHLLLYLHPIAILLTHQTKWDINSCHSSSKRLTCACSIAAITGLLKLSQTAVHLETAPPRFNTNNLITVSSTIIGMIKCCCSTAALFRTQLVSMSAAILSALPVFV